MRSSRVAPLQEAPAAAHFYQSLEYEAALIPDAGLHGLPKRCTDIHKASISVRHVLQTIRIGQYKEFYLTLDTGGGAWPFMSWTGSHCDCLA